MSVVGIIAEFNPFHSGHEFLLNQARLIARQDPIIVIMSGNYVQRGQMAIMSKWDRAKAALQSGADLVLEMPFSTTIQAANLFALGNIAVLKKIGVQTLVFGVEDANLNFAYLGRKIAEIPRNRFSFKDYNQTYSTQYNQMVAHEVGYEVNAPNEILGLAYAVANYNLGSPLKMRPVNRIGAGHDDLLRRNGAVQSASALRKYLLQHQDSKQLKFWLPKEEARKLTQQKIYPNWNLLFPFLKYRLESESVSDLEGINQMSEGLNYKMKQEIHSSQDFASFLRRVKSKRYTYSRLRRLSLNVLLNVTEEDVRASFNRESLLLLGFSDLGRRYLRQKREQIKDKIVSKVDKRQAKEGSLALQVRIDRLFEQVMKSDQNFGRRPIEV